jgi:hypothetical protein
VRAGTFCTFMCYAVENFECLGIESRLQPADRPSGLSGGPKPLPKQLTPALPKVHRLEGPRCSGRKRIWGGCPHPNRFVVPTREEEMLARARKGMHVSNQSLVPTQRRHL